MLVRSRDDDFERQCVGFAQQLLNQKVQPLADFATRLEDASSISSKCERSRASSSATSMRMA